MWRSRLGLWRRDETGGCALQRLPCPCICTATRAERKWNNRGGGRSCSSIWLQNWRRDEIELHTVILALFESCSSFFPLKVALLKLLSKMLLCLSRLSLLQQFPQRENSVLLPKCILLSLFFSCPSRCFCWEKKSNNNMKGAPPWTDKV